MSDIAIRVENLSKLYRIGRAGRPRYETLYDKIAGAGGRLLDRLRRPFTSQSEIPDSQSDYIWALKDVSFEVKRGEVVGIIGRNGAGKSTLLKILSRITEPTEGRAVVYGRVGSLLEVGTGFHPELTGRENIYLNGAILGMKKAEIDRKFDEIVAFAEIEKFIDTPVKFYSSGMYVRLAFAVAAHLDPEILLVDEVLAVGDAAFQKKCLGKMGEVAQGGRTVLFVSHNISAISTLCHRVLLLDAGHILKIGRTDQVISQYTFASDPVTEQDLVQHPGRNPASPVLLRQVRLLNKGVPCKVFKSNSSLTLQVECCADTSLLKVLCLGFSITDRRYFQVFATNMEQYKVSVPNNGAVVQIEATIPRLNLTPGRYSISLFLGNGSFDLDIIRQAIVFEVVWDPDLAPLPPHPQWGPLLLPVTWKTSFVTYTKP